MGVAPWASAWSEDKTKYTSEDVLLDGFFSFPIFNLFRTNISRIFEVRTEDLWVQVNHRNPSLIGCEPSRSLIGCELSRSRSRSRGKGEFEEDGEEEGKWGRSKAICGGWLMESHARRVRDGGSEVSVPNGCS